DNGDYTLQPSSPCIDAGDPDCEDPDGSTCDMGAYPTYHNDYGLHAGANLVSLYALPEDNSVENVLSDLGCNISGVITEGGACSQIACGNWVGSHCDIHPEHGYWLLLSTDNVVSVFDGIPTNSSLEYNLHAGANLISFPSDGSIGVSDGLPDEVEQYIDGVITEGGACVQIAPYNWVGSQCSFNSGKGYWVISTENISFSFELSTLSRTNIVYNQEKLNGYKYTQSSKQAFYFVESIKGINTGDY
ncbi:uncharacterized protein METZ01_LOCUS472633, partial [marine metagenome]